MRARPGAVLVLLFPWAVCIFLFTALPYYLSLELSLYKTNYVTKEFVGLRNFISSFADPEYRKVVGTSFLFCAIICPSVTFIPLFFAFLLYNTPRWVQAGAKFIFFVPGIAGGVIISQVWRWIFQPKIGLLNYLLGLVGVEPIVWMGNRYTAIFGISVMMIMGSMGLPLLLYLSNLLSIPSEIFDAARIDGASNWQIKRKILFPLLVPTVLLIVLMSMTTGFYLLEPILMMTGGGRGTATFQFDIYNVGVNQRAIGLGAARNIMLFALAVVVVVAKRKIEARFVRD